MIDTAQRIDALDNKQAIHIGKKLVETAFNSAQLRSLDDDQVLELIQKDTGFVISNEDALSTAAAGDFARQALHALAQTPSGTELVTAALDNWFDHTADFGLLTGSIAIALLWLVAAPEIEFTVGTFHYHKAGLTGAQQVSITKVLTPALSKLIPAKNMDRKADAAAGP